MLIPPPLEGEPTSYLRATPFVVDGWRITPVSYEMSAGDEVRRIEPKVMAVLACLAATPGKPVHRETLMSVVWADTIVTDDALTRCVVELRKLFDDDAREPRVIETIPRMGYRLIAPVAPVAPEASADPEPSPVPPPASPNPVQSRTPRIGWTWALVGLAGLVVAAVLWVALRPQVHGADPPSAPRPLTTTPGIESDGVLSPDGERVAFEGWGENEADLYVSAVSPLRPLRLTDNPEREVSPAWSPDGQRIAFARSSRTACALYTIPALGGPERRVAECPPGSFATLDWSPDGRHLAVSLRTGDGPQNALHLVDVETGATESVSDEAGQDDYVPRFSPDGTRLAFVRRLGEGPMDVFVRDLARGTTRRVTHVEDAVSGLAWSTDGTSLFTTTRSAERSSMWQVPAAGGAPEWVADAGEAVGVHVAAGRLVYGQIVLDLNVYQASLADTTAPPTVLAPSTRIDKDAVVAPDGDIAFTSDREGTTGIWLTDPEGRAAERVVALGDRSYAPAWGPDGRLAFTVYDGGRHSVRVLDVLGQASRLLVETEGEAGSPTWSPDGRWVVFSKEQDATMDLWRVASGGGRPERLTTAGGLFGQLSANGRQLYYVKPDEPGLWVRTLGREAEQRVYGGPGFAVGSVEWTVADDVVYFIARGDRPVVLRRLDPDTGRVERVRALGTPPVFGRISVSDDAVYFSRIDRREADLFLLDEPR